MHGSLGDARICFWPVNLVYDRRGLDLACRGRREAAEGLVQEEARDVLFHAYCVIVVPLVPGDAPLAGLVLPQSRSPKPLPPHANTLGDFRKASNVQRCLSNARIDVRSQESVDRLQRDETDPAVAMRTVEKHDFGDLFRQNMH